MHRFPAPLLVVLAIVEMAQAKDDGPAPDFARDVQPILAKHCYSCHGADKQRGGLRLDQRAAALKGGDSGLLFVPGQPNQSHLIRVLITTNASERMPSGRPALSAVEIRTLTAWVAAGAPWPADGGDSRSHWAFTPVRRPALPKTVTSPHPIDRFIHARLATEGLTPSAEADRRTLIRRLKFDLLGLPPTPEEVQAFVNDPSIDAYERLVDRFLASPHFGERWARHWLDTVRFAESHGFEMNNPRPKAYFYRDYVIRALNEDKPYDRFVREQLAGDALQADAATGFLVGGPWDQVKSPDRVLTLTQRADELHDMIGTTGSTFLGLTVACARCHSHKFDPIPQKDYYQLKAILADVHHGERLIVDVQETVRQLVQQADETVPDPARPVVVPLGGQRRLTLALPKRPLQPIINQRPELVGIRVDASNPKALTLNLHGHKVGTMTLVLEDVIGDKSEYTISVLPEAEFQRVLRDQAIDKQNRQLKALEAEHQAITDEKKAKQLNGRIQQLRQELTHLTESRHNAYVGQMHRPETIHRLHRGDVTQPREAIDPGVLSAIGPRLDIPKTATGPQRRLALAQWLTHPEHPLTARVMVNRLWHYHFGTGLVDTPSDLGVNGGKPSHPELLDWLAAELVDHQWKLKPIHRLIVTSATYRQKSLSRPDALAKDAQTRLLWRFPPRRLEAEVIRDAMLFVSGQLDLRMGGPGFDLFEPNGNYVRVFKPKKTFGPAEFRRMIYLHNHRMQLDDTFGAFDCPDGGQIAPKRNVSITALQALNLLNSPFAVQQAQEFRSRVLQTHEPKPEEWVKRAFALAFQRPPSEAERQAATELLADKDGLLALCRALFNANEFSFID